MSNRPKYCTEAQHYGGYSFSTNLQQPPPLPPPSLADLLTARPSGLTEPECWAILCQSVQALQDLFLSDGVSSETCIPLVTPTTLILLSRGRVKLYQSGTTAFRCGISGLPATDVHMTGYLAPEYRPNKHYSDTETEKMWIYALGETIKRAVLISNNNTLRLSNELCKILTDMTKLQISVRASLMYLLDVISEYCKRRQQNRPFSHIVMDLHQEAMVVVEMRLDTPWGPPAMPELRPRTRNKSETNTIPRRWINLTRTNQDNNNTNNLPKITKEASTSMEDLIINSNNNNNNTPGRIIRPKSMCVPDMLMSRYLNEPLSNNKFNTLDGNRRLKIRRNPVQRAASRLYHANPIEIHNNNNNGNKKNCIGPEFVVRASLPSKQIIIPDNKNMNSNNSKKIVMVIMLNGQKLDVICNPNSTTAGQLFEMIVQKEHIEENFMLGLSALIAGDFVFLPSDTRICKAIQSDNNNCIDYTTTPILTLFMRIRFFLPNLRGIRNHQTKHLLYLQLRRSILEHQLPCSFLQLIELNGLALQVEFGDFNEKEHGSDYFLIEHYIPETMSCRIDDLNAFRQELIRSHLSKIGLSEEKAKEDFIILAQSLPHYGGHFYTATWILKDNNQKDVWLYISSKGINLYERDRTNLYGPQLYEIFEWRTIQTLCYSKHYLCILPHLTTTLSSTKLKKYKLKMDHKKSYFTFRLASLHHQFFLRLRTEFTSLQNLSNQFGIPLKDMKNETNSLHKLENFQNQNNQNNNDENDLDHCAINAETEFKIEFCASSIKSSNTNNNNNNDDYKCRRVKSINDFTIINKEENENFINCQKNNEGTSLILDSCYLSGLNHNNNNNNIDKRSGVKMGTRMFKNRVSRSMETMNLLNNNNNNDNNLDDMSLQSVSINYSSTSPLSGNDEIPPLPPPPVAYIIDTKMTTNQEFLPDFQETINQTLIDKFNNLSYSDEYQLIKVIIERKNLIENLGLQVVEGSDGNVYVQNVIKNSLAYMTGDILNGDQIVAVNGQNLLNMKYLDCLKLLKDIKTRNIEFILSRIIPKYKFSNNNETDPIEKHIIENCQDLSNLNKYGNSDIVPYHKHIRYEIEPEHQDLILKKYQTLSSTILNRNLSKSCTQINQNHDQQQQQRCRIIDMIPKTNYYSLDRKTITIPPVALPRSLGLSRKYRGPVRYPVTPVKTTNDPSTTTITTTSDDEQVFI